MRANFKNLAIGLLAIGCSGAWAQAPDGEAILRMLLERSRPQESVTPPPPRANTPVMTEADLLAKLAAWPDAGGPFSTQAFRDGFAIAGERVLDPEGRIIKYAMDARTGDAAYLAENLPGSFVVKVMRHRTGQPVVIAHASRSTGYWSVETITGVRATGTALNLSPRGFLVAREGALFHYTAGQGVRSRGLPDDYLLAPHQNGPVGLTGWLLLEKRADVKRQEGGVLAGTQLGGLFNAVKGIGTAIGATKSDSDFALFDIASGKLLPIGIALDEKNQAIFSMCRQKGRWIATCDKMESVESLYQPNGMPNRQHYYWRVHWFQTASGPVALTMEDGITRIEIIDLTTGKRAEVFQRPLGIASWSAIQQPDGRIQVSAQLGFESAKNEDASALLWSRADVTANAGASPREIAPNSSHNAPEHKP